MNWHSRTAEETASLLNSDLKKGLSEQRAKKLLAEHGENVLKGKKQNSVIKQFLLQFKDFCVIILFISCIISSPFPLSSFYLYSRIKKNQV